MIASRRYFVKGTLATAGLAVAGPLGCMPLVRTPDVVTHPLADVDLNQNIGRVALDIERKYFAVPDSCYNLLDEIVEMAKGKIDTRQHPNEILSNIGELLHYFQFKHANVVRFSEALRNKENGERVKDCDTGSLIYLTIGEELGLPLKGVSVPYHFFIRWHFDSKEYMNWETTNLGIHTDTSYQEELDISQESIDNGVYLRSLSRPEILAQNISTIGSSFLGEERYAEAASIFERAIELNPKDPHIFQNYGVSLIFLGNAEAALQNYIRATELDPNYVDAIIGKGATLSILGRNKEAAQNLEQALILISSTRYEKYNKDFDLTALQKYHKTILSKIRK